MKNSQMFLLAWLFTCLIFTSSCKKEILSPVEGEDNFEILASLDGGGTRPKTTEIGGVIPNPFTVANMTLAHNEVHGAQITSLPITHKYVKFTPQDDDDLLALFKSKLYITDYPRHHEIITMGDKYRDPAVPAGQPTYYYAVIPANQTILNVPHTVLGDLHLYSTDDAVIRRAITRVGLDPDVTGYSRPGLGWSDDINPIDPDPPSGYTGPLVREANCSCRQGGEQRNPAGCVRLEDTQLSNGQATIGVRRALVIVRDYYGYAGYAKYTDEFGCYRFYDLEFYKNAWVDVIFQNDRATIMMTDGYLDLISYAQPVKDGSYKFGGPDFRNMNIDYPHNTDYHSQPHRFWRSATILNTVSEHRDWCFTNYVTPSPQEDLQILTTTFANSGAAPMIDKIHDVMGPVVPTGNQFGWAIVGVLTLSPGTNLLAQVVLGMAPDIVINVDQPRLSDRIKSLCFHELAHAQHFGRMESPQRYSYWLSHIDYTITHNGYGDGTAPGADRCRVIENWGNTMGPVIADNAYGLSHSNGGTGPFQIEEFRHANRLEAALLEDVHLQVGYLYDLFDVNPAGNPFEHPSVGTNDNIGNIRFRDMLHEMTHNVTSPEQFRDNMRANKVPAILHPQFDAIWVPYEL